MNHQLVLITVVLLSLSTWAQEEVKKVESREFHGRVARLIVDGLKSSGVKPTCKKEPKREEACEYQITDFKTAEETDGCGGGTTSYKTKFVFADGSKFDYNECQGGDYDSNDRLSKPAPIKVDATTSLQQILGELDMWKTAGWTGYIDAELIKCSTYGKNSSSSHCEIKGVFEY